MFCRPKIESIITENSTNNWVISLCFSPKQPFLCSVGDGRKVILTNLENNKTERILEGTESQSASDDYTTSTFSFDGKLLATPTWEIIRIWNIDHEIGNYFDLEPKGTGWVDAVQFFHQDSSRIISGNMDHTIRVFDLQRKKDISKLSCENRVISLDLLPDNNTIASGDESHEIRIFDLRAEKCTKLLSEGGHSGEVRDVQFHPDSFKLASGSWDETIKLFDIRTYKLLHTFEEHSKMVDSICFHPSGRFLVSGSSDKNVKIFDLETKKVLFVLDDHKDSVTCVQFSPNGRYFASGGFDGKIFHWSFPLGEIVQDPDEDERVKFLVERELSDDDDEKLTCEVLEISFLYKSISLYFFKIFLVY